MIEREYDVIIIGGGPAGSTTAIFLKKLNPALRVCIIDKEKFPRKKSCGDGLSPGVADIIKEAGLPSFFSEKMPISIFQLVCPDVIDLKYDLKNMGMASAFGYVFPREFFDDKLIKHAAAAGVAVFESCEITDITEAASFCTVVSCKQGEATFTCSGRIIVGADGIHSKIRKYVKAETNSDKHMGIALRYYCKIKTVDEPYLRIDILKSLKNSYGWVFPVSDDEANIGIGVDMDIYRKKKINLNHELDKYLAYIKDAFEPELIQGTRSGYPLPYGSELPQLVHNNKVLVGDAASMINPLTGEGIFYAMQAGKMLSENIAESFDTDAGLQKSLLQFSNSFTGQFKNHYQFNLTIKKMLASPFAGFFLKRIARDTDRLNKVMGIILGNTTTFDSKDFSFKNISKVKKFI
jgi:menaquinone-9 beta-reductase